MSGRVRGAKRSVSPVIKKVVVLLGLVRRREVVVQG